MKKNLALVLVVASAAVHAKTIETWECKEYYAQNWTNILVTAYIEEGRQTGSISVAGVIQGSSFHIAGFDRRWDFGLLADGTYQYSFFIQPNGDAQYYDFSNQSKAKPSNFMRCRQIKAQEPK